MFYRFTCICIGIEIPLEKPYRFIGIETGIVPFRGNGTHPYLAVLSCTELSNADIFNKKMFWSMMAIV